MDGTARVENGKLIIENPVGEGKAAEIFASHKIRLYVDGALITHKTQIYKENKIEVVFDENEASREMKIDISDDEMAAYISIKYIPKNVYKLKDISSSNLIELDAEIDDKIFPPKFKEQEIIAELSNNNVIYGIIEGNIKESVDGDCDRLIVAQGEKMIPGRSDKLDIKFAPDRNESKYKEDETGNVDFKSIGSVHDVKKGEIIAVRIPGEEGKEGHDIRGRVKKPQNIKKLTIKVGKGCILKDENTVVSLIDGKPCVRNNVFSVFDVHEVKGDVDLSTGDIKFIGDITIGGGVAEGMQIVSGNSVIVNKDVEGAVINAKGDVTVAGNVIRSQIYGGGEDVSRLKVFNELEIIEGIIKSLVEAVAQIKEHNIMGRDKKDGDIIKLLIETKYKNLTITCIKALADLGNLYEEEKKGELSELLRNKLLGLAPLSIRNYGELDKIVEKINLMLLKIKSELSVPVTIAMGYCQDSIVKSSGDIMVTGKGVYISDITANGKIKFVYEKSVARGGTIKAGTEIHCRVVGSSAGVPTKLIVDKQGEIFVDAAYQNTVLVVGHREYTLEKPSKNIHAHLDHSGDIIVDKLLMEV